MYTQGNFKSGNLAWRDRDLSPQAEGVSLWETCPVVPILQDPSLGRIVHIDFDVTDYKVGDWTITTTEDGAGSATEALSNAANGVLLITNDAADNDSDEFQLTAESFKLASGKPLWIEGRFKVSDATQSDFLFGLCITDTALIDGLTDGVYFLKDDGDANIDFHVEKNSTDTSSDTGVDLVDDTWIQLGFYFDGAGNVTPYVDGVAGTTVTTNIPDDEELTVSFGIQNGEAVAKTLSVDYIRVAQVR